LPFFRDFNFQFIKKQRLKAPWTFVKIEIS